MTNVRAHIIRHLLLNGTGINLIVHHFIAQSNFYIDFFIRINEKCVYIKIAKNKENKHKIDAFTRYFAHIKWMYINIYVAISICYKHWWDILSLIFLLLFAVKHWNADKWIMCIGFVKIQMIKRKNKNIFFSELCLYI